MRFGEPCGDTAEVSFPHHLWMEDATYPVIIVLVIIVGLCHPLKATRAAPSCSNGNGYLCLVSTTPPGKIFHFFSSSFPMGSSTSGPEDSRHFTVPLNSQNQTKKSWSLWVRVWDRQQNPLTIQRRLLRSDACMSGDPNKLPRGAEEQQPSQGSTSQGFI